MKKIYSTIVMAAVLLMAMPAQAQVKFGFRGGANLVNMKLSGDNFVSNLKKDNRAGFYIGPTVKFTVPIVGLSMDASALYDQRSTEVTYGEGTNTNTESFITRQLAIPVNVRYGLGSVADIFLFAGPQVAFNFAKDQKLGGITDWNWKTSNFSINIGLGCTILSHVELKANYNIACGKTGEATVWNATKTAALGTVKSKYNSWQLGMAYYF